MIEYYDAKKQEFFNVTGEIIFFVDLHADVIPPFMLQVEGVTEVGT
jgi:hypothetical protein